MKKLFAIAFGALLLTSCVKDYTCDCTTTNGSATYTSSSTLKGKKSDVKTACEGGSSTYTVCAIK